MNLVVFTGSVLDFPVVLGSYSSKSQTSKNGYMLLVSEHSGRSFTPNRISAL